jgi:hypothetical protein
VERMATSRIPVQVGEAVLVARVAGEATLKVTMGYDTTARLSAGAVVTPSPALTSARAAPEGNQGEWP